jgi:2Fe-2S ferredoxin
MKLTFILKDGSRREVAAEPGATVMQTAIVNNIRGIDGECGGCSSCATCHVYVDEAHLSLLPPPDDIEQELLEGVAAERRPNSRLGCQIALAGELDGMVVEVPARQS